MSDKVPATTKMTLTYFETLLKEEDRKNLYVYLLLIFSKFMHTSNFMIYYLGCSRLQNPWRLFLVRSQYSFYDSVISALEISVQQYLQRKCAYLNYSD